MVGFTARDGRAAAADGCASAAEFLRGAPRGPYAAACAVRGGGAEGEGEGEGRDWEVECWRRHAQRLAESTEAMLAEIGQGGSLLDSPEGWRTLTAELAPPTRAALAALPADIECALLVILVELADAQEAASARKAGALPVRHVRVHARPLAGSWGAGATKPPCAAAVVARGGRWRALPFAKDSAWATQRVPLEVARDEANAAEGLLANAEGELLEGLVSNVFVVSRKVGYPAAPGSFGQLLATLVDAVRSFSGMGSAARCALRRRERAFPDFAGKGVRGWGWAGGSWGVRGVEGRQKGLMC